MSEIAPLQDRAKAFNADLVELLSKHQVGIAARAYVMNDGRLNAKLSIFDDSEEARAKNRAEAEAQAQGEAASAESGIQAA